MLSRPELPALESLGLQFSQTWQVIDHFERLIADFFGSTYAVATDSCTHGLELVLRSGQYPTPFRVPRHTYMSVPMMLDKLNINYDLQHIQWVDRYDLTNGVVDAATTWLPKSYRPGSCMVISFQFKKHLPIGRGGMILLDDEQRYHRLQRMVRDGRDPKLLQSQDDVFELGYHYYMTPEDAARGILLFHHNKDLPHRTWSWQDYRDLTEMHYFKGKQTNAVGQ
jgi:hypothetical protein